MNSLIIGPGAIGALTCAQAQQLGSVYVWPHREAIELPISLESQGATQSLDWQLWQPDTDVDIDVVWVCCKAFHVEASVRRVIQYLPTTPFVLLNNGMGPQQTLQSEFGEQIVWGSTTCGALTINGDHFRQTSFGKTAVGASEAQQSEYPLLKTLLTHQFMPDYLNLEYSKNIEEILWQKILINACINPITAFHQIPNGDVLNDDHQSEVADIIREVTEILKANDITLPRPALDIVNNVARVSAGNRSSMAMDVKHHARTEIDFIIGFLITEAERYDIECPTLKMWYKRIASLSDS